MRSRCAFVVLLLLPVSAAAQTPAPPPSRIAPDAYPTAYVLDDRGVEVKGGLFRIDDRSVVLLVDGRQREFDLAHVTKVSRRGDSLKNGAIVGATVGALMGIFAGAVSDCRSAVGYGSCGAGQRIAIALGGAAFYTAIGVGIDAMIQGRTVIYQAPPRSTLALRVRW